MKSVLLNKTASILNFVSEILIEIYRKKRLSSKNLEIRL